MTGIGFIRNMLPFAKTTQQHYPRFHNYVEPNELKEDRCIITETALYTMQCSSTRRKYLFGTKVHHYCDFVRHVQSHYFYIKLQSRLCGIKKRDVRIRGVALLMGST